MAIVETPNSKGGPEMTMLAAARKADPMPLGATGWLGFAAAPTFAAMALISALGSPGMMICSAASPFLPIGDMALMYLLMSFFHLPPWLNLLSARRRPHHAPAIQIEGH